MTWEGSVRRWEGGGVWVRCEGGVVWGICGVCECVSVELRVVDVSVVGGGVCGWCVYVCICGCVCVCVCVSECVSE